MRQLFKGVVQTLGCLSVMGLGWLACMCTLGLAAACSESRDAADSSVTVCADQSADSLARERDQAKINELTGKVQKLEKLVKEKDAVIEAQNRAIPYCVVPI